jgi:hypothetical protein
LKPEEIPEALNSFKLLFEEENSWFFYFIIHDRLDIANAPFIVDRVFVNPF